MNCKHCGSTRLMKNGFNDEKNKRRMKCTDCGKETRFALDNNTQKKSKTSNMKKYIVLGCVHVPFNNKNLTRGILKMMDNESFDGIVLAGDFLDMAALSSYEKGKVNKTGINLDDEYSSGRHLLNQFDKRLPNNALKVFMFGNHEDRYFRWKSDVDNSKYGDILDPINALALKDRGYDVYSDYANDVYNLGSLQIMHGEYHNIHSAKKHLDVFRRNVLYFHTHRVQVYREGDFAAYNAGFLGNKKSSCFNYAKRGMKNAWANGFAIVSIDEKQNHFVQVVNCVNDRFTYNNNVYGKQ